jgi:hypothetical protein
MQRQRKWIRKQGGEEREAEELGRRKNRRRESFSLFIVSRDLRYIQIKH